MMEGWRQRPCSPRRRKVRTKIKPFLARWCLIGTATRAFEQESVAECWPPDIAEKREQYDHCCEHPPGTPNFNSACFGASATWVETGQLDYGICCAIHLGLGAGWSISTFLSLREIVELSEQSVRVAHAIQNSANRSHRITFAISENHAYTGLLRKLPAYWADYLDFSFPSTGDIRVFQLRHFYSHGDWGAEDHVADKTGAVVWSSAAAWFMVGHANTWILELARLRGRRLRLLELASGIALTVVAAAKSNIFDMAVGVDVGYRHRELLDLAIANAKCNGVEQLVKFLPLDICSIFDADEVPDELLSWGPFDVVTIQQLAPAEQGVRMKSREQHLLRAVPCAHRLMQHVMSPGGLYLDVDSRFYLRRVDAHLETYPDVANSLALMPLGILRLAEAMDISPEEGKLAFPMDEAVLWEMP